MTIREIISDVTSPLKPTDTIEHALGLLMEFRVRHLPVVDDEGMLRGLVSEERLLDAAGPDAPISSLLGPAPVSVTPNSHVFDVTKTMMKHDLTTIPVAQPEEEGAVYVGMVKRHDIFEQFARMLSTQQPGAILALEIAPRDYSLSQLVYDIEQHGSKILSIATEAANTESEPIRVTVKLNATDTARIRHVLEHHGYRVVACFSELEDDEDLQFRVQEFMRYLEV